MIRRLFTTDDLFKLAQREATVAHVMKAWQRGDFPSFEAALVHLAVTLAKQNADLTADLANIKVVEVPAVVVSQNFCK